MESKTASDLFKLSLNRIKELSEWKENGTLKVNNVRNISAAIELLSAVTHQFMDALYDVARSGTDDLVATNSQDLVFEHVKAYDLCEATVQSISQTNVLEAALAISSADAVYVDIFENKPLRPIIRDKDLHIPTPTFVVQPATFPIRVSQAFVKGRRRTTGVRRSPRLAKEPPATPAPRTDLNQLISGTRLTKREKVEFVNNVATQRSTVLQHIEEVPKEIIINSVKVVQGVWSNWVQEQLEDPTTTILDSVAAVSSSFAGEYSVTNAIIHDVAISNIALQFARIWTRNSALESQRFQDTYVRLLKAGSTLVQNSLRYFWRVWQQSSVVSGVIQANVVELLYGFVTLFLPSQSGLQRFSLFPRLQQVPEEALPEQTKKEWFKQLHYWAPFLSLVAAATLIAARPLVVTYITSSFPEIARGAEVASQTPGALITTLARTWLGSESPAFDLLNNFYVFAARGMDSVIQAGTGTGAGVPFSASTWIINFGTMLARLHRLRFVSPMLHIFSLAEWGIRELTVLWRWTAIGLKKLFQGSPTAELVLDWLITMVDLVLLVVRTGIRMLRYRGVLLLMYAFVSTLAQHGMSDVTRALNVNPEFDIQWGS